MDSNTNPKKSSLAKTITKSIATLLLTASCATTIPTTSTYIPPKRINQTPLSTPIKTHTTKKKEYQIEHYQINKKNITIYNPQGSNPSVLVIPQLKGADTLAHWCAKEYASNGIASCVLEAEELDEKFTKVEFEEWAKENYQTHKDLTIWLKNFEEPHVGVVGISFGAIVAASLAKDLQTDASVMIMGSSNLQGVVQNSHLGIIKQLMKKIPQESIKYLQDPKQCAKYVNPKTSFLFISKYDKTVPTKFQEELRQDFSNPKTTYLPTNHYLTALYLREIIKDSSEFLEDKLVNHSTK